MPLASLPVATRHDSVARAAFQKLHSLIVPRMLARRRHTPLYCEDCGARKATIRFEGHLFCVLHASCSKAARFRAKWEVIDKKEMGLQEKQITPLLTQIKAELAAELS